MAGSMKDALLKNGFKDNNPKPYNSKPQNKGMKFNKNKINSEIEEILNYIKSKKGETLKQILDPKVYALPKQSNGKDGWAKAIADNLQLKKDGNNSAINSNQLRKFFSEIKAIERSMDISEKEDDFNRIWLLVPQIAYAYNRGIVKKEFYDLMTLLLNDTYIKDKDDFDVFVNFYEAIIAYFDKNRR